MNFTNTSLLGCSFGWRQEERGNWITFLGEFHEDLLDSQVVLFGVVGQLFEVATVGMKELHYLFE